jgi:stress response protein YsnF
MTLMKISKRLAGVSLALGFAAIVAGCHSSKSDSHASLYSEPSMGGTSGYTSYSSSSGQTESSTQAQSTQTTTLEPGQGQQVIPLYEEQIVVGTRQTESGGVRLRKDVTTETVNQPVQIRRETIVIDRQEGSGSSATSGQTGAQSGQANAQSGSLGTPFEKGEIVIRLHNEEPVVEKRVVPAGRIVVQTRSSTEQTNVQREVRKEKINVEKMGDSQNVIVSEKVGAQSNEAVGSSSAEQQQIKGSQSSEPTRQSVEPSRTPVTTDEGQPFPRPQPDGRETFPYLNKSPERK